MRYTTPLALTVLAFIAGAFADDDVKPVVDDRPVIEVGTIDELLAAIGPDRIVRLKPGRFEIDKAKRVRTDHVRWGVGGWDAGEALTIRKADRLTIEGMGDKPVELVTNRDTWVLNLAASDGVTLVNLKLGHSPERAECTGGVLRAEHCDGLRVVGCELYGCGTEGFDLIDCDRFVAERCVVHSCTFGIMMVRDCAGVRFERCRFERNEDASVIRVMRSTGVELVDTFIRVARSGDGEPEGLFRVEPAGGGEGEGKVKMTGGGVENLDRKLWAPHGHVEFENVAKLTPAA